MSTLAEQLAILRRIAERALAHAQLHSPEMVDVCQHMIDEAIRAERYAASKIQPSPL